MTSISGFVCVSLSFCTHHMFGITVYSCAAVCTCVWPTSAPCESLHVVFCCRSSNLICTRVMVAFFYLPPKSKYLFQTMENWNAFTFIASQWNHLKEQVSLTSMSSSKTRHCQYGRQPWQKQNRTERVNWLPEAPPFFGQQIDARWIKKARSKHQLNTPSVSLRSHSLGTRIWIHFYFPYHFVANATIFLPPFFPIVISFPLLGAVLSALTILFCCLFWGDTFLWTPMCFIVAPSQIVYCISSALFFFSAQNLTPALGHRCLHDPVQIDLK